MKIARYQSAAGPERLGIVTSVAGRELLVDVAKVAAARGGLRTPESVMALIEGDAPAMEATRELPPGLAFDGPADPVFVKSILDHVHCDWSGKTQSRGQERQKVNARITVVPGFKDIMRTLEFAVSDSLDFTDQPTAESWVVDDVSEGGYGTLIPSVAGDWVEVGSLVGVEGEVPRAWRVGVIRRVQRVEGNQQHVGVQLLSRNAMLVRMRRETERQAQMGVSQRMPLDFAILLSADAATNAAITIGLAARRLAKRLIAG